MKESFSSVAVLIAVLITSSAFGQEPSDYHTAYKNAQAGDKPLLVLVTAQWCPPCQEMKKTTVPQLLAENKLDSCHFAMVDYDQENELALQLVGGRGVPQLIIFEKKEGRWLRRYLRGFKEASVVEAFVAQAEAFRTAQLNPTESPDTQQDRLVQK